MATATKKTRKQTEVKKVLDAVVDLRPQGVIEEIGALQNTLQTTLAGLSAQISNKLEQMRNVEEAIKVKQDDLTELYGIEQEAMSLEEIRAQYEAEDTEWSRKMLERQAQWEDDDEDRAKRWQREEEEHAYEVAQRKKRSQEEFVTEVSTHRRAEAIRQEDLQKQWKTREDTLAGREKELTDLKTQVGGFEDKLKVEVAKAEAIAVNRVKKEYEHNVAMLNKDIEAERTLNATKISAMDDTINSLQTQIGDLQKQLANARMDAKEVTNAALQSASGRQAMDALQRVVDNTPSSGKTK